MRGRPALAKDGRARYLGRGGGGWPSTGRRIYPGLRPSPACPPLFARPPHPTPPTMRLRHPALRPALGIALAAVLAGCYSSRPALVERERGPAPVVPDTVEQGPARVGLAATMDLPENPYGDSADVAVPDPAALPSLNQIDGREDDYADAGVDPADVAVTRYYYDDAGTYYYEDVADDLADGGLGADDDYYYGGYYADYYRYGDPSYYPSLYTYYRPYRVYNPYRQFGWYNTWNRRYGAFGYSPYYAGGYYDFYDPYFAYGGFYDPFFYGPGFGINVSFGYGFGGYGFDPYYGYGYAGYYGPGYYGRPRYNDYYTYRDSPSYHRRRGQDDGVRSPVRGAPGTASSPVVESMPNPSRMPSRRGLNPARIPRDPVSPERAERTGRGGIGPVGNVPGRATPDRADLPRAPRRTDPGSPVRTSPSTFPGRTVPSRAASPAPARTARPDARPDREWASPEASPRTTPRAPRRAEEPREPTRSAEPRREALPERRPVPHREARPAPPPRRESRPAPPPRRESRPAPPPRQESRPSPPPRRESRPAPPPRRESRPAPPPQRQSRPAPPPRRQESAPARSSGGSQSSGRRSSRRGGNNDG